LGLWVLGILMTSCGRDREYVYYENQGATRYNDQLFSERVVQSNIQYGEALTQGGASKRLTFTLYTPKNDLARERPLIILAYGTDLETVEIGNFNSLAQYFVRSGYVVASIEYRTLDVPQNVETTQRAILDAAFDMKAAVRYFHRSVSIGNIYGINPSQIFIGGYGAGAVTALHAAYLREESEVEAIGGTSLVDYMNAQGGIEGNSGNNGFSSAVRGVVNLSGGLLRADLIDAGEPTLISFHGSNDQRILPGQGAGILGIETAGSTLIHAEADRVGVENELHLISEGDHLIYDEEFDFALKIRSFLFENL
ncbi:MAG: alpha/beta hydrolase, partial [Bacteroidota bacterium]